MSNRVAVYCIDYYPSESGYSFAFQELVKGLLEHEDGLWVDVFTPVPLGSSAEVSQERLRVFRLNTPGTIARVRYVRFLWATFIRPWLCARFIVARAKSEQYRFILFESLDDYFVARFLPKRLRDRIIVRVHATSETEYAVWGPGFLQRMKFRVIRSLLRRSIRYIAATSAFHLAFVKRWYLNEDQLLMADKRFMVIPNSVPTHPRASHSSAYPDNRINFLTLGRMDVLGANQKGFDDILSSLALLPAESRRRVRFTFIGKGSERARLMGIARVLEPAEIEFIESLPNQDVSRRLHDSDCIVLASRYEGMSIFALEAIAHGRPVIFSDAGGIADLVDGNGFRYPAGDAVQLSHAISRFLGLSNNERCALAKRSLEVASRFTSADSARRLMGFARLMGP
ncbi:glycosyltransferase family 4 protein [Azohydromonas sediminis]|uniref:glycosyltransferase family 4 protein n=1 Tax=Azohydromonas sediminis TaxID=2259674 RepID=UPI000E65024D|nr:glycosyltransferase family 4 protein [Azohydromonas sediminis]